jgi:hypothetical protein
MVEFTAEHLHTFSIIATCPGAFDRVKLTKYAVDLFNNFAAARQNRSMIQFVLKLINNSLSRTRNLHSASVWLAAVLTIFFAFSCENPNKDSVYYPEPTSLQELFSGFNEAELTPVNLKHDNEPVVIIATGHLYPLLNYPGIYENLINRAIAEEPDYFFNLGDMVYNNTDAEWDLVFKTFEPLPASYFYAPGNHDLNYHYERYVGKRDNQIEAELRYLKQVGYRYRLLQDQNANYVFINANDSAHRIRQYLDRVRPQLEDDKIKILVSSQSLWHDKYQEPDNPKTWVKRPFHRDTLLKHVQYFDVLLHGDWGGKFFRGKWKKKDGGHFEVLGVGNRKPGDTLYITRLEIYKDSIAARPILIDIPEVSKWFD